MRWITRIAAAALAATLQACVTAPALAPQQAVRAETRAAVTILVSIDGFRPDYLARGVTPVLSRLAADGVQAAMRPSFPSKTFPNHWTLVTGLRPDRNGVVANRMEDARRPGEVFTMATDDPFWWDEAEPIWVAAERAGVRSATMFWPGSNVAWGGESAKGRDPVKGGVRPDDWQQFNQAVSGAQRVESVLDWMRRPAAIRPRFVTLYFDTVDSAGHAYGPADPRTTQAVADIDGLIGKLVDGLAALGQPANIVLTADHGMAATSSGRVVLLKDLAAPEDMRVVETGPYASLAAAPGHEAALEKRLLGAHPHVRCWRKAEIPARLHYGRNPRVPPYLCLADDGWLIQEKPADAPFTGGNHGYDQDSPDMAALFVAHGPAFVRGRTLAAFDNVAVYPLVRRLIGLPPAADRDGDLEPVRAGLR